MRLIAIGSFAICSMLLPVACQGASMDMIVCRVDNENGVAPAGLADHLCKAAAEATQAAQVSAADMKAILASSPSADLPDRLHLVEIAFPSNREIAFAYAYGTPADWNEHREKRFDDLHVDIMDAELNSATVGMFADTLRRLSR